MGIKHYTRAISRSAFLVACAIVLITCFQNCNSVTPGSKDSSGRYLNGGEGTDGKVFRNYALCPQGKVDVANVIVVSPDQQSAAMVRQNCADLILPQAVASEDLRFGLENQDVFELSGKNYDRQKNLVSQQVTVDLCRTNTGDTEVRIWKYLNSSSGLFGSVTQKAGSSSEALLLDPGVTGPGNYATRAEQSSQFSLTTNNGSVSLTYSIEGSPQKTVSNLTCGAQASPPPPALLTGLTPPAGYTANLLTFEDRFLNSNLDTTKWIPQIADQNGIWRQSVPAPYSASNSGGNNAEFYDPQHAITGGGLNLVATRDTSFAGYSWRSGCISSHGLFYLRSGYVQVRARFPDSSSGMWAAINFFEGGSNIGIASGFLGGSSNPNRNVFGNLLSPGNSQVVFDTGEDLSADYHVYGMEYRPGSSIKMYIDGKLFATYTNNVPTGAYEIVLNLAVAQNAASWHTMPSGSTLSPSEFDVSDVQVYNLPP
jgi:hypothetical protein